MAGLGVEVGLGEPEGACAQDVVDVFEEEELDVGEVRGWWWMAGVGGTLQVGE